MSDRMAGFGKFLSGVGTAWCEFSFSRKRPEMPRFQQAACGAGSPTSQTSAGGTAATHLLPWGQFHSIVKEVRAASANRGPKIDIL